jgi:hypothetical protein
MSFLPPACRNSFQIIYIFRSLFCERCVRVTQISLVSFVFTQGLASYFYRISDFGSICQGPSPAFSCLSSESWPTPSLACHSAMSTSLLLTPKVKIPSVFREVAEPSLHFHPSNLRKSEGGGGGGGGALRWVYSSIRAARCAARSAPNIDSSMLNMEIWGDVCCE